MTGTSASLVAIVGGLLVARFVGLDSAQQGADRVLADVRERLVTAQARATAAGDRLLRLQAQDFLEDAKVLNAIQAGTTDITKLRVEGWRTPLTDDVLQRFVDRLAEEFTQARAVLDDKIPAYHEIPNSEFRHYAEWREFRRQLGADLPPTHRNGVWERVFFEVSKRRSAAYAEWKKQHPDPPKSALENIHDLASSSQLTSVSNINLPPISPPPTDFTAIRARRHDELRSERDRTQQQVEDLQAEVRRLGQAREAIVKPDGLLWQGIVVLILFSAAGVIAPLWAMSRTPGDLTPHLRLLFWGFSGAFGLLVVYLVFHVWRLTRKNNNRRPPSAGNSP